MLKYLTTQGLNYYLENLLKNAESRIILISPYIKIQRRIQEILRERKQHGVRIDIVCRKKDLAENIAEYTTNIFDVPTLHAKCYINEREAIITSLNLYEFSQQNNEEMGIYVNSEGVGKNLYSEIVEDAEYRFCKISGNSTIHKKPDAVPLKIGTEYTAEELDNIFDFSYKGRAGIKDLNDSEDLLLFSNSKTQYQNSWKENRLYFQGQNTGPGKQQLIFGNKKLMDAYHNPNIKLHLFEDYVYFGVCTVVEEPYMEKDKWIFPLSLISEKGDK